MVTLARRFIGVLFVVLAVAIYLDGAERGSFACERATATCIHSVERLHRAPETQSFPLKDVIGAAQKWSYWEEAPGARAHLASARSMADLDVSKLYQSRPQSQSRTTSSSTVIFTRQGIVPLLPGFVPGHVEVRPLAEFLDGQGERVAIVQDERFSALPLPVVLLGIGAFLILLPRNPRSVPSQ